MTMNPQQAAGAGRDFYAGIRAHRRGDDADATMLLQPADVMLIVAIEMLCFVLETSGQDPGQWLADRLAELET